MINEATANYIAIVAKAYARGRNAALEEAAKVADAWGASKYSADCTTMADTIATDIRALASDPLLDMPGNGKEGV